VEESQVHGERVGQEFDALIISAAKYGVFVELAELFIEGLVPLDTLPATSTLITRTSARLWGSAPGASSPLETACG